MKTYAEYRKQVEEALSGQLRSLGEIPDILLTAMGLSPAEADCTLRFSLCPDNTEAEMDDVARCVKRHYDLLKAYVRR